MQPFFPATFVIKSKSIFKKDEKKPHERFCCCGRCPFFPVRGGGGGGRPPPPPAPLGLQPQHSKPPS